MKLDSRVMLVWLVGCLVLVFAFDDPYVHIAIVGSAALVASKASDPTPFSTLVGAGFVFTVLRTALFAVAGHTGSTVIASLPEIELHIGPASMTLGGPVMAEVIAQGLAEGLKLLAVVASFGAFTSIVGGVDLLRLVPRFLFDAALVVNIALAFTPQLVRTIRDVRDAQVMRGGRRSWRAVTVPVVAEALERSVSLAEGMESRGYGSSTEASASTRRWRALAVVALTTFLSGALVWMSSKSPEWAAASAAGAAIALLSLWRISRLVVRTAYRPIRTNRTDRLAIGIIAIVALGSMVLVNASDNSWSPYEDGVIPPLHLAPVSLALAAVMPIVVFHPSSKSHEEAAR